MTSYVYQARPRTEEMLVDEMLAICAEIETWREKKESQDGTGPVQRQAVLQEMGTGRGGMRRHEEVHPEGKAGQEGPQAARQLSSAAPGRFRR